MTKKTLLYILTGKQLTDSATFVTAQSAKTNKYIDILLSHLIRNIRTQMVSNHPDRIPDIPARCHLLRVCLAF